MSYEGKPHAVGDQGQRYEVTFFNPAKFARQVLGWSDTLDGAERLAAMVAAHPVWEQPHIVDRQTPPLPAVSLTVSPSSGREGE